MIPAKWLLTAMLCVAYPAIASAEVVYSNGFEASSYKTLLPTDEHGSVQDGHITYGGSSSYFLGAFSNNTVSLSLSKLVAGTSYDIAFDLFIGGTMDGNYAGVADNWRLTTDTGETLIDTRFSNLSSGYYGLTQTYSDTHLVDDGDDVNVAGFTGADVHRDFGDSNANGYSIYYFGHGAGNPTLSFTATDATTVLTFEGDNMQGVDDEFWAIDNVVVSTSPPTDPTTATTPEPTTLTLLALGAVGFAGGAWRKRRKAIAV